MCVVLIFMSQKHAHLDTHADTNFTFGTLIRSNRHVLCSFVPNITQSLELRLWTTRWYARTLSRLLVKPCYRILPSSTSFPSLLDPLRHNWASDTQHLHPADSPPLYKHRKDLCVCISIIAKKQNVQSSAFYIFESNCNYFIIRFKVS